MNHLTDKKKVTIMIAIMVALFFSAINQTIIGVAMPRIIAKLGVIKVPGTQTITLTETNIND
ncbi:hypothetical protein QWT69_14440 [Sporosarcina oncorhynchi]|uniref:MFS transporter n=1 Tax=Sporosarcina oncorhynchi TaxID=3056444 RepID=A0ABZ0L9U1_9BACL|nr:hypothetical protein [Sporosarcina sp. T2O-4]WOV89286.1 hypothetical protein QWT69_14440 [Sporosarcina sp. T2O-4]